MKKSSITAIAVTVALALHLAKPENREKKDHMRPSSLTNASVIQSLLSDLQTLRKRPRQHIAGGAETAGHLANHKSILERLNGAFTTEIV